MYGAIFSKTHKGVRPSNKVLSIFLVLFLITSLGYALLTYLNQSAYKEAEDKRQNFLRERSIATGLRIDDFHGDRKRFTLLIESIEIHRKKVGVLRLGFWKVEEFRNVRLNLFEYSGGDTPNRHQEQEYSALLSDDGVQDNLTSASAFGETIFNPKKMEFAHLSGVKSIEIKGLKVIFFKIT